VAAAHRRRHEALEQLLLARLHHREADAPDAAPQQVHAEQPRDEEVDVPRAGLGHALVAYGRRVRPAPRMLQHRVHLEPGQPALGAGRVVAVYEGIPRDHEQRDAAGAEPLAAFGGVEHHGLECR
jgi:hypothetical protein